jgi:hAT family C-terminal dimerisation region
VWASWARDILPIMASSVSSERAFSSAGVTISKRRNRLKGDIVEALQCVKCSLRHDLIFREPAPSSAVEMDFESDDGGGDGDEMPVVSEGNISSWDLVLDDDEDDDDIVIV